MSENTPPKVEKPVEEQVEETELLVDTDTVELKPRKPRKKEEKPREMSQARKDAIAKMRATREANIRARAKLKEAERELDIKDKVLKRVQALESRFSVMEKEQAKTDVAYVDKADLKAYVKKKLGKLGCVATVIQPTPPPIQPTPPPTPVSAQPQRAMSHLDMMRLMGL